MSHIVIPHALGHFAHVKGHPGAVAGTIKAHRRHRHGNHGLMKHGGAGLRSQSFARTPIVVLTGAAPVGSPATPGTPSPAGPPVVAPPIGSGTPSVPNVSGVLSAQEQTIVTLVNQQRQQAGLAPLQVDSRLVEAAQIQSADMAQLGQMEHTLPGAALPALQDRARYVGYSYSLLGENLAFNYPDGDAVMNGWMNSPGHRDNILNPGFTQVGVGIAYDSGGEPYYTEVFGAPA